jgi:Ca-activated chloride channel family protein
MTSRKVVYDAPKHTSVRDVGWSTITQMVRMSRLVVLFWCGLVALAQPGLAQNVAIVPRVPPAQVPTTPDPVLRVDSCLVLIPAHVTNALGAPITGLTVNDFRVSEDGVDQTISEFAAEDAPVSVGLLFDTSGSMRNKMEKASQAAAAFFRTANAQDEFFLVEFGGRTRLEVPFTTNSDDLYQRIVHTRPSGQTPLFDAVHLALKAMKNAHRSRKALVILSDGGDNWSGHNLRQIRSALVESDVQVYAMGIFDADVAHNHPREEKRGPMLLEDLTGPTGGKNFPVERLDDLPAIGERISRELRHEYLLGYYSTNAARDGKYRRVKVDVVPPGVKGPPAARVSFRPGYYAPAE